MEKLKALQKFLHSDQQLSALSGSAALLRAQEELGSVVLQLQGGVDSGRGQEAWETGIERLDRLAESLAVPGSLPHYAGGQEGRAAAPHVHGPQFAVHVLTVPLWPGSKPLTQVACCTQSAPG